MIKLDNKFTENLSPHEQLVMLQLLVGGDENGITKTSYRVLANKCGITLQICRSTISKLQEKGELEIIATANNIATGTIISICKYDNYRIGKKKIAANEPLPIISSLQDKCKERARIFENSLIPFVTSRGGQYKPEMVRAFFNYWTEKNKSGTKMRFEMEKTWEVSKRLQTWAARNNTYKSSLTLKTNEMNYDKTTDWG